MPEVRASGCEGSCVGFAVAAALEDQIRKSEAEDVTISPRYIYYHARKQGGFATDRDTGAHLKDAVVVLLYRGAVAEEVWPYQAGEFAARPTAKVERARHYGISEVQRIRSLETLKTALQEARSVVGGLCLFPSACADDACETGWTAQIPLSLGRPVGRPRVRLRVLRLRPTVPVGCLGHCALRGSAATGRNRSARFLSFTFLARAVECPHLLLFLRKYG
jgi:hypothetical protein